MSATEAKVEQFQEGFRVHVGNLSFATEEEQLRAHLAPAGGSISSVVLPLKFGTRPSGYAFVAYEKEEDAKNVVEKLNGSELDGRQIKLDPARSKEETDKFRAENQEKRDANRAARDAAKAEKAAAAGDVTATGDTTAVTEGEGLDGEKPKKKRPSKKRAPRRRQPGEEGEEGTAADATEGAAIDAAPVTEGEGGDKPKPKRRTRKPREPKEARIDGVEGEAQEGEAAEKPKRERKPRVRRSEPTGELSKTSIFVANLPYDVDDDALTAIFTNLSINVKSAKVVTGLKRFKDKERKPVRTSKGFGFVEVDEAQQQEAVAKVEGSLVGERTISAKIANEMRPVEVNEVEELAQEAKEAEAAAASAA